MSNVRTPVEVIGAIVTNGTLWLAEYQIIGAIAVSAITVIYFTVRIAKEIKNWNKK